MDRSLQTAPAGQFAGNQFSSGFLHLWISDAGVNCTGIAPAPDTGPTPYITAESSSLRGSREPGVGRGTAPPHASRGAGGWNAAEGAWAEQAWFQEARGPGPH